MLLDINEIKKIIPHRAPFLLIDKVTDLIPGERCTAYKNVSFNEPQFMGHFPEEPVMPGVLMIEGLAQTGAVMILSLEENKGKIAYFGGIKSCKFRKKVVPGDVLKYDIEITKLRGPIGVGKGIATVDGAVAVECELTFVIQ
ncbi:MAG: 3-hydroxyacyl-ACP dehydratase FabZ [Vallitaleaceae bacterium]|jgi:3-hydroxyacyl-[acyl-carrier-protein] dehydratase|nr:3-hydroxyacyl-ACP dehydratase FabZ [Vallitaleaceae bacterium]